MIIVNPEFHRHLWLNFSPIKLIMMPLILGLMLYLFAEDGAKMWQAALFLPSLWLYIVVIFLWGNHTAASSTSDGDTWDFLKMSSISPWELVVGRLFGATSYVWYTGILLLIVFAFSYGFTEEYKFSKEFHEVFPTPVRPIIYLVFSGVIGHATSFLFSIGNLGRRGKTSAGVGLVCGFLMSCTIAIAAVTIDMAYHEQKKMAELTWFFWTMGRHTFSVATLLLVCFWVMTAIQRNVRDELQYKNSPIVFTSFVLFLCLYFTGLVNDIDSLLELRLVLSCFIMLPFTYFTLFAGACNFSKYKRWLYAIKDKEWKRLYEDTPTWVACSFFLIAAYSLACVLLFFPGSEPNPNRFEIINVLTMLLLFMARDSLVFHTILSGWIEKHKSFMLMIYYVLIYGLIPSFIPTVLGLNSDDTHMVKSIFYPISYEGGFISTCYPAFTQAFIALLLFIFALKRMKKNDKSTM